MNVKLISTEELIDDEEVTVWRLDKGNGRVIININKSLNNKRDSITECEWLDEGHRFIQVNYSDWDSRELIAIMNVQGEIIRKGILSVEEVLDKPQLFIVQMSGAAMDSEAAVFEFGLAADDWKMAVLDEYGEFIIEPSYDAIWLEKDETFFCATGRNGDEYRFSLDGERAPNLLGRRGLTHRAPH